MGGGCGDEAISILEFPDDVEALETSEFNGLCGKVREACESHGFFLLRYDKVVPKTLRKDMMEAMKALFDLPEETKSRYSSPMPYRSYKGNCPIVPLYQSFGIDDADKIEIAQQFTNLMWPEGNPSFCEIMHAMSAKMRVLNSVIMRMIFGSFCVSNGHLCSYIQDSTTLLRLMKYRVPDPPANASVGLVAHTDKNAITILCQNDVQGLEVILPGNDKWVPVTVPKDAFIVIVGDALKAWSNGRLHSVKHRVVMSGDKERYSYGLFSFPKDAVTISVPNELVDTNHPLRYRPFKYADYISYFVSNIRDDALEIYAGV